MKRILSDFLYNKIFTAKSMTDALIPMRLLIRFAGLAPFTYRFTDRGHTVQLWGPLLVWTAFLMTVYAYILSSVEDSSFTAIDIFGSSAIQKFGDNLQFSMSIICVYTLYIAALLKRNSIANIIYEMTNVDTTFLQLGESFDYGRAQAKVLFIVVLHTALSATVVATSYFMQSAIDINSHIYLLICFYFANYVVSVFIIQFVVNVILLEDRFKRLNGRLRCLQDTAEYRNGKLAVIPFVDTLGATIPREAFIHSTGDGLEHRISLLSSLHEKLCDVADMINRSYNIQILSIIAISFVTIVFNLFYVLEGISLPIDAQGMLFEGSCFEVCVVNFIYIILLASVCSRNLKEGKKTAILVHKLLNKNVDNSARKKLFQFSMQLNHRVPTYSAFGLFPLDASLIYMVVGSTTTYLIILVQFATSTRKPRI